MGRIVALLTLGALAAMPLTARAGELDGAVAQAVRETCAQFKNEKLKEEEVAATVIDLRDPDHARSGSFRGEHKIFPASVVKLFYLAATHRWLEDGKLQDSEELRRTMADMIVDSSNDATAMILEALTDATNGAPLAPAEMEQWAAKRNAVNRYFASLGYSGINVCQKTYCEGPYGREKLFIGPKFENRNYLTTDATARLLGEIVAGKSVSPERSKQMMELLKRDASGKKTDTDSQATGFTAMALPGGSKLWSKAGWTSTARHDAAYVETPGGGRMIVVIFTTGHARERKILPSLAEKLMRIAGTENARAD